MFCPVMGYLQFLQKTSLVYNLCLIHLSLFFVTIKYRLILTEPRQYSNKNESWEDINKHLNHKLFCLQ